MKEQIRIIVAQMGGRMNYAVPVLLNHARMLQHFYTDAYAGKGLFRLAWLIPGRSRSNGLKRLLGRNCEIPPSKITAFNKLGFQYARRRRRARSTSEKTATYLWAGDKFGRLVIESGLDGADVLYTVKSASSLLLEYCHTKKIKTVFDHFSAPHDIYHAISAEEKQLWPGWEEPVEQDRNAELYAERERQEWQFADLILAPSQFVLDGLIQCSVPREKCRIVPYGIDVAKWDTNRTVSPTHNKLKVLFVGGVHLPKGIQYLIEAADKLGNIVDVRVVGGIGCNKDKLFAATPANTEYTGHVPQIEVHQHFQWADVFCLPSLCEGSAGVTYQALASGLPVICTPNTGSVVRDGIDGYIVPIRNSDAIAEKLDLLARDRQLLAEMSRNARQRAKEYDLPHYGERLVSVIEQLREGA